MVNVVVLVLTSFAAWAVIVITYVVWASKPTKVVES